MEQKKYFNIILVSIIFIGFLIVGGYFIYKNYFSIPSVNTPKDEALSMDMPKDKVLSIDTPKDENKINSTLKPMEINKDNNPFRNLGISLSLPEEFSYKLNISNIGFEYINISYPEKGRIREKEINKKLVCYDGGCIVIRHGSTLFPESIVANNDDVKKIIKEYEKKYKNKHDHFYIVREWNKDNIKFLHTYTNIKYGGHEIIFIESQNPQNFIAVLISSYLEYNKSDDLKDENYKKIINLVDSIKIIGTSTYSRPTNPYIVYKNEKLGIQFEYPSEWGAIEEFVEKGCHDSKEKITKQDQCEHIGLTFADLSTHFLSSRSALYNQYPNPRGAYWGDLVGKITDESFIKNYCNNINTDKNKCRVYKNANDVLIARSYERVIQYGDDEEYAIFYYIKLPHPVFPGVMLSTYNFKDKGITNFEQKMDKLIDSLSFVQ